MAVNTGVDMSIYLKILEAEQKKAQKDYEEEKYTSPLGQRNLGIFNTSLAITGTIQESRDNYLLKKAYKKGYFYDEGGNISKHDAYERSGDPGFLGIWEKDLKMVTEHPKHGTLLVDKDGNPLDYDQAVLFKAIEEGKMEDYSGQTVTNPVSGEYFDWNKYDASKLKIKEAELKESYTEDEYKKETSYSESERALLGLEDNYVDPEESDAEVLKQLNEIEAAAKAKAMDYDTVITKAQKEVIGASYENNSQTEALEGIITDGGDPTELLESTGIDRDIQISGGILIGGDTTDPIDKLNADVSAKVMRDGIPVTKDMDPEFRLNKVLQEGLTGGELKQYLNLEGNEEMKALYTERTVKLDTDLKKSGIIKPSIKELTTASNSLEAAKKDRQIDIDHTAEMAESEITELQNEQATAHLTDVIQDEEIKNLEEAINADGVTQAYEATEPNIFQKFKEKRRQKKIERAGEGGRALFKANHPELYEKELETLESSAKMTEQNSEYKGLDKTMDYNSLEGWNNPVTGEPFKGAGQRNRAYDMKVAKAQKDFKIDNPDYDVDWEDLMIDQKRPQIRHYQ